MNRPRVSLVLLALVLVTLAAGFSRLWRMRFSRGDVFPPYSTLRADPLGTRALHDALQRLPGLAVERSLKPLAATRAGPPRTLVLAGMDGMSIHLMDTKSTDALDAAVRAGSRLVVTFRPVPPAPPAIKRGDRTDKGSKDLKEGKDAAAASDNDDAAAKPDWRMRWGIETSTSADTSQTAVAARHTPPSLPLALPWMSGMVFDLSPESRRVRLPVPESSPWRVLYERDGQPVLVERALGAGSIVFAADSFFVSNEAMQLAREPALLAWLVGPHARVVFDEAHLGVREDTGIAALGRRYGLGATFVTFLLFAALFVWRRAAAFVPPAPEEPVAGLDYKPTAGIEALLRRSVPPRRLAETCLAEWSASARSEDIGRAAPAIAAHAASPAAAHNAAARALGRGAQPLR